MAVAGRAALSGGVAVGGCCGAAGAAVWAGWCAAGDGSGAVAARWGCVAAGWGRCAARPTPVAAAVEPATGVGVVSGVVMSGAGTAVDAAGSGAVSGSRSATAWAMVTRRRVRAPPSPSTVVSLPSLLLVLLLVLLLSSSWWPIQSELVGCRVAAECLRRRPRIATRIATTSTTATSNAISGNVTSVARGRCMTADSTQTDSKGATGNTTRDDASSPRTRDRADPVSLVLWGELLFETGSHRAPGWRRGATPAGGPGQTTGGRWGGWPACRGADTPNRVSLGEAWAEARPANLVGHARSRIRGRLRRVNGEECPTAAAGESGRGVGAHGAGAQGRPGSGLVRARAPPRGWARRRPRPRGRSHADPPVVDLVTGGSSLFAVGHHRRLWWGTGVTVEVQVYACG